ncbi:MAG: TetR/AcrR family transcriptional regulator [Aggregatilineales bacterium]
MKHSDAADQVDVKASGLALSPGATLAESDVRSRILRDGALLFQERGYASTTMREVARRVGVTPGALYWHFESKEAILVSFLEDAMADMLAAVRPALVESTPLAQLDRFVRGHLKHVLAHFDVYSATYPLALLVKSLPEEYEVRIVDFQKQWVDVLRTILSNGIASGVFRALNVTPTALAIATLCDYVVVWYEPERMGLEDLTDLYSDLVEHMVRSAPRRTELSSSPPLPAS